MRESLLPPFDYFYRRLDNLSDKLFYSFIYFWSSSIPLILFISYYYTLLENIFSFLFVLYSIVGAILSSSVVKDFDIFMLLFESKILELGKKIFIFSQYVAIIIAALSIINAILYHLLGVGYLYLFLNGIILSLVF